MYFKNPNCCFFPATSSGEGSSIPTSPEHETEEEGGMNALLKAIELHTQGDGGKRDVSDKCHATRNWAS